ncbi:MAG: fatty acid desaturase [Anaerolineae bacterium]
MSQSESTQSQSFDWRSAVAPFQNPDVRRSLWQLANTLIPFFVLWYLAYRALAVSYLLTLPLAIIAGGLLVRVFIIFHDCGHGSFFANKRANDLVGVITGILTFTPYYHWRHSHAVHHSSAGDLDRRGTGDVWTLTVDEYMGLPRIEQLWYRLYRSPLVLLLFGPPIEFLLLHRFAAPDSRPRERSSVVFTNLALLVIITLISLLIGFKNFVLVQFPVIMVATVAGVWLFYVQHQFEDVYWERHEQWDYVAAALQGSSFYRLPRILQWFTGNIGFHHIHHLSPRIPNYRLEECHKAVPRFQEVKPLTLLSSLRSITFRLWDEENRRLVGYDYLKQVRPGPARAAE